MLKSVLCTENGGTGVDAAVVTVSDDMSIYAEWPSHTLEHLGDTGTLLIKGLFYPQIAWVKVFRINPEFRILRLTFHRKSASKC